MVYCGKCGKELPEESKYCLFCGTLVPDMTQPPEPKPIPVKKVAEKPPEQPPPTTYIEGTPRTEKYIYQAPSQMYCDYCGKRILDFDQTGKCAHPDCRKVVCQTCLYTKKGMVYCPQHYPQCLIATSAFGNPLNKEIILLRKYRDNELKKTEGGKKLLERFEKFYYSFSPSVARKMDRHPTLRTFIRYVFVEPLIGIFFLIPSFSKSETKEFKHNRTSLLVTGFLWSFYYATLLVFLLSGLNLSILILVIISYMIALVAKKMVIKDIKITKYPEGI